MTTISRSEFDAALAAYVGRLQHSLRATSRVVGIESLRRYIRVFHASGVDGSGRSAIVFVDRTSGDVYASESWQKPAPGVRDNIFEPK